MLYAVHCTAGCLLCPSDSSCHLSSLTILLHLNFLVLLQYVIYCFRSINDTIYQKYRDTTRYDNSVMVKLECISHFAAAIVTDLSIHVSAALAYSLLLARGAWCHQSVRLRHTIFGRRMFTSDVRIPESRNF